MATCYTINTFQDVEYIAGGEQYFEYSLYNSETGALLDITDIRLIFTMNSLTNPSNFDTIEIEGEKKNSTTFRVTLTSEQTANLRGVYIQQPKIIDYSGKVLKPTQGKIVIYQANN